MRPQKIADLPRNSLIAHPASLKNLGEVAAAMARMLDGLLKD